MHGSHVQPAMHACVPPVQEAPAVQVRVAPSSQANPLSAAVSPSSSHPSHVSARRHAPHVHDEPHVWVPDPPQAWVHDRPAPRAQSKVSSVPPSQSSSTALQVSAGGVQAAGSGIVQVVVQVPEPVVPQVVVHEVGRLRAQSKVSSVPPSQSSSTALQVSAGGVQAAPVGTAQASVQVPEPVVPQVAVQATDRPRTHAKVSSVSPSQSSSIALHVSAGGAQAAPMGIAQVSVQVPEPVVPQVAEQETTRPRTHGKVWSVTVSQSSSIALQVSTGGVQSAGDGIVQISVQVPEPVVPQVVVHATPARPCRHAKSSSVPASQSSSIALQVSPGGVQVAAPGGAHSAVQTPVPVVPHEVRHGTVSPGVHCPGSGSSVAVSQSSSIPLPQCSTGGSQAAPVGIAHPPVQIPLPVVPHVVVHSTVRPCTHGSPLSAPSTQSSSSALQISAGGLHVAASGTVHVAVQVPVPVVRHPVVHATVLPRAQSNPSSVSPSQLSSMPLHTSAGGRHAAPVGRAQASVQRPAPEVPQSVVHGPEAPRRQSNPSSVSPSQSSSRSLQVSAGGTQAPQPHVAVHVWTPSDPQSAAHGRVSGVPEPSS
jgi:hypothetical protein